MPDLSPVLRLATLAPAESPSLHGGLAGLRDQVERFSVMRFASVAERDTRLIGAAAPVNGMTCYTASEDATWTRTGGRWRRAWADHQRPTFSAYASSPQTLPSGLSEIVAFPTTERNVGGWVTGPAAYTWVVPVSGWYRLHAGIRVQSQSATYRLSASIRRGTNGDPNIGETLANDLGSDAAQPVLVQPDRVAHMDAGDNIAVVAVQTSGATLTIETLPYATYLEVSMEESDD